MSVPSLPFFSFFFSLFLHVCTFTFVDQHDRQTPTPTNAQKKFYENHLHPNHFVLSFLCIASFAFFFPFFFFLSFLFCYTSRKKYKINKDRKASHFYLLLLSKKRVLEDKKKQCKEKKLIPSQKQKEHRTYISLLSLPTRAAGETPTRTTRSIPSS